MRNALMTHRAAAPDRKRLEEKGLPGKLHREQGEDKRKNYKGRGRDYLVILAVVFTSSH